MASWLYIALGVVAGVLLGAAATYIYCRQKLAAQDEEGKRVAAELQAQHAQALAEHQAERARLDERLQQQERSAKAQEATLQEARKQLGVEFSNLANRIFEEKSKRMTDANAASLKSTLDPLKNQLGDFRKRVDEVHASQTRDRASLLKELEQLKSLNRQMSDDAANLTKALKGDSKTRGDWGEVVLEKVLEESGLHKGREYETQFSARSEDGKLQRPDVVVRLPEGKDIIIDAKVPLVDYERYVTAEDEDARQQALAAHVGAVRGHIAGLSVKAYENLPGLRSLDFVLLFIPIESAFMAAFDSDPKMFREAYDRHVIVVSPTTLLATLRTVQTIWRYERQNKNVEEIARRAGKIHDKFALVLEAFEDVGRHIDKTKESWEQTRERLKTGRGNLVKQVDDMRKLGAHTKKKLPSSMTEDVGDEDESE